MGWTIFEKKNVDSWLTDARWIRRNHFHTGVDPTEIFCRWVLLLFWFSGSTYQNIRYMLSQPMLLLKIELPYLTSNKRFSTDDNVQLCSVFISSACCDFISFLHYILLGNINFLWWHPTFLQCLILLLTILSWKICSMELLNISWLINFVISVDFVS